MFEVKSVAQTAANIRMREVGQTKWHELALSLCEAFDQVVQMSEKRERAAKKACKRGENSPHPSCFSHFFSLRCLHYLRAWNTLNFGSRAGQLAEGVTTGRRRVICDLGCS